MKEILNEVLDEIKSALEDSQGMVAHQRRLAFSLSLGAVTLIEGYLRKLNVFKSGSKINHLWLKKKKENAKKILERYITTPVERLEHLDQILELAYQIEKERNELAYGKPVSEIMLRRQINSFFKLKELIENV